MEQYTSWFEGNTMLNEAQKQWLKKFVDAGGDYNDGLITVKKMNLSASNFKTTHQVNNGSDTQPPTKESDTHKSLFDNLPTPKPKPKQPIPNNVIHISSKRPVGRPLTDHSQRPKTQQELDLFELSLEIDEKNAAEHGHLGFIASAMIYASLPHSKVEGAFFKRKSGNIAITILNDPDIGLPYGKLPRIITAFLCTEAKKTKNHEIFLGKSQAEFAAKLGLGSQGGKRGDITRLKDQAMRLFTSHITLTGAPDEQFHWRNVNLTDDGMLLWSPHNTEEQSTWESKLTLSNVFYKECMSHAVPIDLRIIHKLTSPLAIDIYIWLTYRLNFIRYDTPIAWQQLKWQFGANYADTKQGLANFKNSFRTQLRRVLTLYPDAKVQADTDKLILKPSLSHIKKAKTKDS